MKITSQAPHTPHFLIDVIVDSMDHLIDTDSFLNYILFRPKTMQGKTPIRNELSENPHQKTHVQIMCRLYENEELQRLKKLEKRIENFEINN